MSSLPGPPLVQEGSIAHLIKHAVKVGLGPQGLTSAPMCGWAVRNLRFDAAWVCFPSQIVPMFLSDSVIHYVKAYLDAPNVLSKASAFALASSNVEELLGLKVMPGEEDLVATAGGDLLGFEGKVVAVISPRRGIVDLF